MERLGYFIGIVSVLVASSIATILTRRTRSRSTRNPGVRVSIPEGRRGDAPGTIASRTTIMVGFAIGSVVLFTSLGLSATGCWSRLPVWAIVEIPESLRWIGLGLIWCYYGFGVATFVSNPNYTPCHRKPSGLYFIAMGGPYSLVRHPMYALKAIFPVLLFVATGLWIALLGCVSWAALGFQARSEERYLVKIAGDSYRKYLNRTGRFLPGVRR
jgi:protein-S-isoprenylcysteine O-methyltransferase Ste14